ncbi:MAG: SPOR domain-containing protein [Bacteroidota bacterium]
MSVEKHISELLYEHDCVIVPQLGGFVANYASAKIHPTQHTFIPPSKNIVFNKNLINNDGLLANHIAVSENTDYPQALRSIDSFVTDTHVQLKKGIKVKVDEVGTLYLDVERNIQFEPGTNNYLLDAFGLAEFQSPAIKLDTIGKRIEKEFKDRDAIPQEKKKINIKRYVALAIVMPLIFGMIWIPLRTDLLKGVHYSDLNPFASKETALYTERKNANNLALETKDFEASPIVNEKDTARYITFNLTENSSNPVTASMIDNAVEAVKPDSTKVVMNAPINGDLKFHLVTGCFQVHDNAINFVKTLQQKNLSASIIGQNRDGLYVVSCGDFASRKEASAQLEQLRKIQPEAWLYKK